MGIGMSSEKTESSEVVKVTTHLNSLLISTVSALTAPGSASLTSLPTMEESQLTKTAMTIRITPTMMTRALSATIMKMGLVTQSAQSWAREPFRTQWESQYLLLPP